MIDSVRDETIKRLNEIEALLNHIEKASQEQVNSTTLSLMKAACLVSLYSCLEFVLRALSNRVLEVIMAEYDDKKMLHPALMNITFKKYWDGIRNAGIYESFEKIHDVSTAIRYPISAIEEFKHYSFEPLYNGNIDENKIIYSLNNLFGMTCDLLQKDNPSYRKISGALVQITTARRIFSHGDIADFPSRAGKTTEIRLKEIFVHIKLLLLGLCDTFGNYLSNNSFFIPSEELTNKAGI